MEEMSMFAAGGLLIALIPLILYLCLIVFGIYFAVKVLQFMKEKAKLDQERNQLLKELINKNEIDS